jgi:dTDP-4-dehydrorhamnose 3,5-epimerase
MKFITKHNFSESEIIQDVIIHPLKINKDESGVLVETLRKDWEPLCGEKRPFFMQYYSITPPGLARDEDVWHYHPTQEDRFLVIQGDIVVAIADNRKESKTFGLLNLFYMQSQIDPYVVLVPKKTLHGFMVVSKTQAVLANFPTALYNPAEEERIPYGKENILLPDKTKFCWDLVRKHFQ